MMSTGSRKGRPKSWVQDHVTKFTQTEVDDNSHVQSKDMATCNYCSKTFRYNTSNLCCHILSVCTSISADVRDQLIREHGLWEPPKLKRQRMLLDSVTTSINTSNSNDNSNSNSNSFNPYVNMVQPLTTSEKEEARKLLAKAIFDSAIPFDFVENDFFKQFCKVLRPDFVIPTSDTLSKKMLPIIKEEVKTQVESKLKQKGYTWLGVDGSQDNHNSNITHILALTPKPLVLKVYHTGSKTQTAAEIHTHVKGTHAYVNSLGVETDGILTDNENKMKAVQNLYEKEYKDEDGIGCSSHSQSLTTSYYLGH